MQNPLRFWANLDGRYEDELIPRLFWLAVFVGVEVLLVWCLVYTFNLASHTRGSARVMSFCLIVPLAWASIQYPRYLLRRTTTRHRIEEETYREIRDGAIEDLAYGRESTIRRIADRIYRHEEVRHRLEREQTAKLMDREAHAADNWEFQ